MAHSLEVRVPFLDPVVVDHALSLPSDAKLLMQPGTLDPGASYAASGVKRIVCDVARNYLPPWFFERRAKKGFALPYGDWLRGPLFETMNDALSSRSVTEAGLFDARTVDRIRGDFLEGHRPWSHPWLLMVTELWRREVLSAVSANASVQERTPAPRLGIAV
jgi:asparagine synthase (glutamine-hydrolysing)